jgi:hypothetical protein
MPTTREAIESQIREAVTPGFRGRLLARGQARAMIWRDGVLPDNAPEFSPNLSYDLQSYGYALLGQALRLRELEGDPSEVRSALEQAGAALEAVFAKGRPADSEYGLHLVIAAASYHLGSFSARAYSLLRGSVQPDHLSPIQSALVSLMLRDLGGLETLCISFRRDGGGSDRAIVEVLERFEWNQESSERKTGILEESIDRALCDTFLSAMTMFLTALERGDLRLKEQAVATLRTGVLACSLLNLVNQWWSFRLASHIVDDLWEASFHRLLPPSLSGRDDLATWKELRETFVASLFRRRKAEFDVWPSQREAVLRSVDETDHLVVSLPTSAGKTRIAELCILRCLAGGRRVIFVTPLRSLSAQTESALQRTFAPLGKTVSSLYGSTGVNSLDVDALRTRDIVVATPEKLDFALRNEPGLLNNVGLLIFDEGHMIGLSEREVRYEAQIQRLLKRADAATRRIVCLSAILPASDQLEDFSSWLRQDDPRGTVTSAWRPTRLHYGEVIWHGTRATLRVRVGEERPYVPEFITHVVPPRGRRRQPFPRDAAELSLASAWKLASEGQSVLIYCPVRRSVDPLAARVIDLHERGLLEPLLVGSEDAISSALSLGEEWLGPDHPVLRCLRLGVAVHHAALPSPYRREVERLIRGGSLRVTISSPTLAQGLNLSASVVIIYSLHRNRDRLEASEFRNVVGRAGRAYVDVGGLVLYPVFDNHAYRIQVWEELISDLSLREMESGLVRLVITLLRRMLHGIDGSPDDLIEHVTNSARAWEFRYQADEQEDEVGRERARWAGYVATLDTAILSLIGDIDVSEEDVPAALDEILSSSLWERRLNRRSQDLKRVLDATLTSRARHIWRRSTFAQRRGYFLAGIGLDAGLAMDAIAADLLDALVAANGFVLTGEQDAAIEAITGIAERVICIPPFSPDRIPVEWRDLLRLWLSGQPILNREVDLDGGRAALSFVETFFGYTLPWAMEAIRVRALANEGSVLEGTAGLADLELGVAVRCVESGMLDLSAATLIRAGFGSRLAAIEATRSTAATFKDMGGLRAWLSSAEVKTLSEQESWPSRESRRIWLEFVQGLHQSSKRPWVELKFEASVDWSSAAPAIGTAVRFLEAGIITYVLAADGAVIGNIPHALNSRREGLLLGEVVGPLRVGIAYLGPESADELWRP